MHTSDEFITRRQLAELLGMTVSGIDKLFLSGRGPPRIADGRTVRYAMADVDAWLSSRRQMPPKVA